MRLTTRQAFAMMLIGGAALSAGSRPMAQEPTRGLNVAPVYEGWEQNADGSYNLFFGYFNRNLDEFVNAPVGPANSIEPGGPDQGQPTYFMPRRNQFVFSVRVPKDFGSKELVWTVTSGGKTEKAYGTLKPDYVADASVRAANIGAAGITATQPSLEGNRGPTLKVQGELKRRVKVGDPVLLTAIAMDDGKPTVRHMMGGRGGGRTLPNSAAGLRFVWIKYRGAGDVTFDPPQFTAWEDTREGANSPWAPGFRVAPLPPDNKWDVRATFKTPGEYVLRAIAHDGALQATENVTVVVTP